MEKIFFQKRRRIGTMEEKTRAISYGQEQKPDIFTLKREIII